MGPLSYLLYSVSAEYCHRPRTKAFGCTVPFISNDVGVNAVAVADDLLYAMRARINAIFEQETPIPSF